MSLLLLKPGREKSLLRRHPWIFSGAISRVDGNLTLGQTIAIRDSNERFLAWAAFSPQSQIAARVWSFDENETIDAAFFRHRLARAISLRSLLGPCDAARLVHGESDGLPGITVDRYSGTLVMQLASAGAEAWREVIADCIVDLADVARVVERSDIETRKLEGLTPRTGTVHGPAPRESISISENGLTFWIDVEHGHKTGFYLDQKENRALISTVARGRDVLDCFCYSGGFAINAVSGGARSVVAIDSSCPALDLAQKNLAANKLDSVQWLEGDVFQVLRTFRAQGRRFDLIVLDPPKFAPTAALISKAARAYKDINLLAFKLLRPGGLLATFSCSGAVSSELFQKIVAGAALDAGVSAQIIKHLHAATDHPVALEFPEGEYLKGLLCRVAE